MSVRSSGSGVVSSLSSCWLLLGSAAGPLMSCADRSPVGSTSARPNEFSSRPVDMSNMDANGANQRSSAAMRTSHVNDAGSDASGDHAGLIRHTATGATKGIESLNTVDSSGVDASVHAVSIEVCAPGTSTRGRDAGAIGCEPCQAGTYSSGVNWLQCEAWSECGWAPVVAEGSSTSDRVCESGGRIVQFGSRDMDTVSDLLIGHRGAVYVAGSADADFVGFARLSGASERYVARVTQGGRLEWVRYLVEALGLSAFGDSRNVELVQMGENIVAVWREEDFDGYRHDLVATEVAAHGEQLSETRVALELDIEDEFPPTFDVAAAIAVSDEDIVIVGSQRESTWDSCGSSWVFRMRLNGGVIWRDTHSLSDVCVGWETAAVRNGVVYLGGNVYTGREVHGLVQAIAPDGAVLSSWTFEQTAGRLESLVVDEDDNRLIAFSNGVDTQIQKWAVPETQVWSRTLRGAYLTPRLALGHAGSVWVTGGTDLVRTEHGYDGLAAHYGSVDVYVEKIAVSGETVWLTQFGSSGDETGTDVAIFEDRVYVAGETDGAMGVSRGGVDGFVGELVDVVLGF